MGLAVSYDCQGMDSPNSDSNNFSNLKYEIKYFIWHILWDNIWDILVGNGVRQSSIPRAAQQPVILEIASMHFAKDIQYMHLHTM